MICVTGDCHSDFRKFSTEIFPEQKKMTKDDFVIICGDFRGIWYQENSKYIKKENYWLDWLDNKPFTTLFVDGNHENFTRLNAYPVKEWNGGKIHEIRPSIFHLMRGEVFFIDDKKIFTFGGASSHDISDGILDYNDSKWQQKAKLLENMGKYMYRVKDLSWWPEELPSEKEMQNGWNNLQRHNNEVDYIITHCASASTTALLGHGLYSQDRLTQYLEEIRQNVKFQKFFFGHYHIDRQINHEEIALYEQIVRIS